VLKNDIHLVWADIETEGDSSVFVCDITKGARLEPFIAEHTPLPGEPVMLNYEQDVEYRYKAKGESSTECANNFGISDNDLTDGINLEGASQIVRSQMTTLP
jgi:hypothetical protein